MPLFARFVRGFVGFLLLSIILSLSGGCRFCVCCVRRFAFFNISVLIGAFCRWFVFFCANFFSLLMSVFIFFSAVECCLLRFVFFNISAL